MIKPYPWQLKQWQQLVTAVQQDKLPHALLLAGIPGLGKQQFAQNLAQFILCQAPHNQSACNACTSCLLFTSQNHPDYYFLQPEEESKSLKIDTVRTLITDLQQTAQQGTYKVAILSADQLNQAAANCLLKTLEEPTRDTIIILLTSDPERLLATLCSRCQKIDFAPSWSTETQSWLHTQGIKNPGPWLNLAEGAPLSALQYAQDDVLKTQYQEFFDALTLFWQQGNLITTAARWQKLDGLQCVVWLWQVYLDLLRLKMAAVHPAITHEFHREQLRMQHDKYTQTQLLGIITVLQQYLQLLRQHATLNLQLQLEALLIEILPPS